MIVHHRILATICAGLSFPLNYSPELVAFFIHFGIADAIPTRAQIFAFRPAQQITVRDAGGNSILFVKQKMFRLKEKVEVFSDSTLKNKLFEINADRVIDFSANYIFTAADGSNWGAVRRHGMRSLWSAHYEVIEDNAVDMHIRKKTPGRNSSNRFLVRSLWLVSSRCIYSIHRI